MADAVISRDKAEKYLHIAIDTGEALVENGAEASRVEDTVSRILFACGAVRTDVFSISSNLTVTAHFGDFDTVTESRRIRHLKTDMTKIEELNQLSREICARAEEGCLPDPRDILKRLDLIQESGPVYSVPVQFLAYAFVSGSFTLFFGGDMADCIAGALIGMLLKLVETFLNRLESNRLMIALLWSAAGGILAQLAVIAGLGHHADLISIGNIMLFIPGIAFTNSIRDFFYGDTITGLVRFCESVILAVVIAAGFTAAGLLF